MAQFARSIKRATEEKKWKPQDFVMMSDPKKRIDTDITLGIEQTANPNTIAIAIFSTFRSLCRCCCPALADCSPGILCDLSFK